MLMGIIAFLVVPFSSFLIISKMRWFKEIDCLTRFIVSFIAALLYLLLPLYFVGILFNHGFNAASWTLFGVSLALGLTQIVLHIRKTKVHAKVFTYIKKHNRISFLDWAFLIAISLFAFKYAYLLALKGIFDWDATVTYLPFAKYICQVDRIPLTGYNYNIVIKPVGISILYSWLYSITGSIANESFRLVPLPFILMTAGVVYLIARDLESGYLAKLSVIAYTLLPLHDSILFYASYYPDIIYNFLVLTSFYFVYRYFKSREWQYCLIIGISLGLAALMKAQAFYFVPAILFMFLPLSARKSFRVISVYLAFIFVGFLNIFISSLDLSFFYGLSNDTQVLALIFIFAITSILMIITEIRYKTLRSTITSRSQSFKCLLLVFAAVMLVASIWYMRNYIITGSLLYTSAIKDTPYFNKADLIWTYDFLSPSPKDWYPEPLLGFIPFVSLVVLLPIFHPVLSTIGAVPKVFSMIKSLSNSNESVLMIIWILGYFMGYFWSIFPSFGAYILNPRDLIPFAPFLSIFWAMGLVNIISYFKKGNNDAIIVLTLLFQGFISLIQSTLLFNYPPTIFENLFASISYMFNTSWAVLAGIIPNYPRQLIAAMPYWIYFSFAFTSLFLIAFYILRFIRAHRRNR